MLVLFQLALSRKSTNGMGVAVFVAKWVDNMADGATFFSVLLTYTALISFVHTTKDPAMLFWQLLLFFVAIVVFAVCFTAGFESFPWLCSNTPKKSSVTTNQMISDWYIGQWAWLIAFAGWTCLLSLFGDAYLGLYDTTFAWWALCLLILCGYIGYALVPPCCPSAVASLFGCCEHHFECANLFARPEHRVRQSAMLKKSVTWLLGVGLYFTLKKTFVVFADALAQQEVDNRDLAAFAGGTATVCFVPLFLMELFRQHLETRKHTARTMCIHNPDDTCTTSTAAAGIEGEVAKPPHVRLGEALETMLKLVLCYITGKAFEAVALANTGANGGGTLNFAWIAFKWQLGAGAAALVASAWTLKTQRAHGDGHSAKCVCALPSCHPEFYAHPEVPATINP